MTNVPAATVVGVTLGGGVGRGAPEALLLREDGAIAVQEVVGVGEPDDGPVGEPEAGAALALAAGEGDGGAALALTAPADELVGVPLAFGAPTFVPLGAAEDTAALVSELAVAFAVVAKGVGAALIPAVDDALATDGAVAVSAAEVGTAVGVAVGVGLAVALGAAGADEEVAELALDGTAGGVGVSVGVALELETATLGIADARAEMDAALVLDKTVGGVGVG